MWHKNLREYQNCAIPEVCFYSNWYQGVRLYGISAHSSLRVLPSKKGDISVSIENTSMVHVGMSIVNLRPQTLDNLKKLYEWASSCKYITVTIFNKSGSQLISIEASRNFRIIETGYEDLYTTMSRLEVSQCTHIWWVNDDDYFDTSNLDAFKSLTPETLYLPNMVVVSDFDKGVIDWTDLVSQRQPVDQYLSYWKIGAPLIFSILPVSTFNIWVKFVSRDPFHLPHLDTQLNLLASVVKQKILLTDFTYHYGTQNWQDVKSVNESAVRYALEQSMDPNYIFTMNLVRNIENVCIIVSYFNETKGKNLRPLLSALLDLPSGPAVVVVQLAGFLAALASAPRGQGIGARAIGPL